MDAVLAEHCERCRHCGQEGPHVVTLANSGVHHAKVSCVGCGRMLRWLPKPDGDPTKYKRPQQHRDLVIAYGNGFCEMCLRSVDELPKGQTLEAQHVREYQHGGKETRENIWIVCTACHRLIHHTRTYHGHNQVTGMELADD